MAGIERHPVGAFCWVELGTSDVEAAKTFYSGLFGWTSEDMPLGEGRVYSMLKLADLDLGAMHQLTDSPPRWVLYVNVENVDDTVAKVQANGGQLAAGPFDVGEAGRMAAVRDPQGAEVRLWQARKHIGMRVAGAEGTLCWSELATTDCAAAREFYTRTFPWSASVSQIGPIEYTQWMAGERPAGGMLELTEDWEGAPPHWMPYFLVADCDLAAERAAELGATLCVPPADIPSVGRFAVLTDPQGAAFSIFKPATGE